MTSKVILPRTDLPADSQFERLRYAVERELLSLRHLTHLAFEGRMSAHYSALVPPTGGNWIAGDTIRNKEPVEAGAAGSMYVVLGWICTQTGNPGVWKEMRFLTGA
jgi:hypothetical protein